MPKEPRSLAAVHYYFLLKSEDEDLQRLWSELTASAGDESEKIPSLDQALSSEQELFSLDLGGHPEKTADRCRVVHRIESGKAGFSLCMLADMAVVEVEYWRAGDVLAEEWRRAAEVIEMDRDRLLSKVNGVFGETTILVAPAGATTDDMAQAAGFATGMVLTTSLDPAIGDGAPALLVHFPEQTEDRRDYYTIVASDPEPFVSTVLPGFDSLVKKLTHTATYFEVQRSTIVTERTDVDRAVGALLHSQVVSGKSDTVGASTLEEKITSLSRMFGLLATDSLLVRQASERLANDIKLLNRELDYLAGPEFEDGIGAYYVNRFSLDLEEARSESHNLDFSRQNAEAAIEVVRTQVEILRAGEEAAIQEQSREILSRSLVLQKERLALQVAAGFIEFVLVFYYVLKSWEGIAGAGTVEQISPLLRLLVVGGFSMSASIGTHFLAQVLQHRSWRSPGFWISLSCLVLSLAAMVILTIAYE